VEVRLPKSPILAQKKVNEGQMKVLNVHSASNSNHETIIKAEKVTKKVIQKKRSSDAEESKDLKVRKEPQKSV
jgi:hypothetical protein